MSRFDSIGAAYGAPSLNHQHGITMVYRPRGRAARSITGIPHYDQAAESGQGPVVSVDVRNDSTLGILVTEIDRGQDELEISAERPGGTASRRKIGEFSDPVGGWVTLELR